MEPDRRDAVVDFVGYWQGRAEMGVRELLRLVGVQRSKYEAWRQRYGQANTHNGHIPRDFWLEEWEREAIVTFAGEHPEEGYRRLTYMLMDADRVAVSPATVYRVLKGAGLLRQGPRPLSRKGRGFEQPLQPHEHWHIDLTYLSLEGTFYYLGTLLDGYSRYIVDWELRARMGEQEVAILVQRAQERFPQAHPRLISDNGPQFIARDFHEFLRSCGMTQVRTSPHYPQSNGKLERYHRTLKEEGLRPGTPLSLADAYRLVERFVRYYNEVRLHSAIGYVTPKDKLEGRDMDILALREERLSAARARRQQAWETARQERDLHRDMMIA